MFGGSFYKFLRSAPECLDAMKAQYRQVHKKDIALEVYSPREMKRMTRIMLAVTGLFYAVPLGVSAMLAMLVVRAKGNLRVQLKN